MTKIISGCPVSLKGFPRPMVELRLMEGEIVASNSGSTQDEVTHARDLYPSHASQETGAPIASCRLLGPTEAGLRSLKEVLFSVPLGTKKEPKMNNRSLAPAVVPQTPRRVHRCPGGCWLPLRSCPGSRRPLRSASGLVVWCPAARRWSWFRLVLAVVLLVLAGCAAGVWLWWVALGVWSLWRPRPVR